MPNCFNLTRKGETKPTALNDVDVELCKLLNLPVDDKHYIFNWYNDIGFALACGKTFQTLQQEAMSSPPDTEGLETYLKIIAYLDTNFTSNAWVQIGK